MSTKRIQLVSGFPTALPANGGNADTVNGHTVESDVPSDLSTLLGSISTNYDESIIALEVDGQTVTYTKGDGSSNWFNQIICHYWFCRRRNNDSKGN